MIISYATIRIEIPQVHSLKGRRRIVNSIKERLKKFNISVLDISGEYAKEAEIALVWLSHDKRQSAQTKQSVESVLDSGFGEFVWEMEVEEI